jgi:hypothetical protein
MPTPFEFKVTTYGRDDCIVRGTFDEKEEKMLHRYLAQYELLAQSQPLREGFPCQITIKFAKEVKLEADSSLPDDDTLGLLLHRMRPFILKKEPASFMKVSNVLSKRLENNLLRRFLHEQRALYDGREFQKLVKITSNDQIVNSEKVFYDWLNSYEYHQDESKRETIESVFRPMPNNVMRGILISMLVEKVRAIFNVAEFIAVILRKSEMLEIKTHDLDAKSLQEL